jgi:alkylation response protein AidB-like acyl-CoA dehydrogenase
MDTTDSNVIPLGRHPTSEELMTRARALVPALQERAQRCEDERRVPEESVAEFERAGLLRMCQPARYGGYEMGWDVLCDLADVLAAACGSQAWLQHIFADHTVLVATFPAPAQEEVWGKSHNAITSASFDPAGRATRVDGGFLFSGRHGFASGIDYADWLICGGWIVEKDGLDGPHFFLVPKGDAEVLDDWDTMALEGTGSKSFVVTDKFIPSHRFLDGACRVPESARELRSTRRRSIVRRVSAGRLRPAFQRWPSAWRGACSRSGLPIPGRERRVASRLARSKGRRSSPRAPRPRSTPRMRSIRRRCEAACANSRRAEPRAAPSA